MPFPDICGWVGTILLLAAYGLVSMGKIEARGYLNQSLNLFGALGIGYNSWEKDLLAVVVLDGFWGAVAIFTMINLHNNKGPQ